MRGESGNGTILNKSRGQDIIKARLEQFICTDVILAVSKLFLRGLRVYLGTFYSERFLRRAFPSGSRHLFIKYFVQ